MTDTDKTTSAVFHALPEPGWICPECEDKGYTGEEWNDSIKACSNRQCLRKRLAAIEDEQWTSEVVEQGLLNRGHSYARVQVNEREAAFAEQWEYENEPRCHINHGGGILQDLLTKADPQWGFWVRGNREIHLTPSMRYVAATAIQWLGSNIGWCFLQMALKKCGYKITKDTK